MNLKMTMANFSQLSVLPFASAMITVVAFFSSPAFVASIKGVNNLYYVTPAGLCIKCPPGKYFLEDCRAGDKNSTRCIPCRDGKFLPQWNIKHDCRECRKCSGLNEIIVKPCSSTNDTMCGCQDGYFHYKPDTTESKCFLYKACGKGFGVEKEGTPYEDVECAKCITRKTFSDVKSTSEKCKECTNCSSLGLNETKSCTLKSDTECDYKTSLSPGTTSNGSDTEPNKNNISSPLPPSEPEDNGQLPFYALVIISVFSSTLLIICISYCCCRAWFRAKWETFRKRFLPVRACGNSSVRYSNTSDGASACLNLPTSIPANLPEKILKSDATLDDVFDYVSYNHGAEYRSTALALPGEFRLTAAEVDNIDEIGREIPEKMIEILNLWKEKNTEEANFDNLYKTLSSRKPALACDIDRLFSQTES